MSYGRDDNGRFGPANNVTGVPSGGLDDGYWEALLEQGEVATSDHLPPWIGQNPEGSAGDSNPDIDDDDPQRDDWTRAELLMSNNECCQLAATGFNRGGLLVQFGEIVGFIPSSHLVGFPAYQDPFEREEALLNQVGQELNLRVIEIDRSRNRLILSERAALDSTRYGEVFDRLNAGDVVSGRVSNLRRFGAFVDLGGFEGLIHISEMSWGRVNHPGDVVQPGDEVEVAVLDVNSAERKIQLSLKRLHPDPWQAVVERYQVGQLVKGEVTNVVSFGAFVCLEAGIEGLVHISELAEGNFLHPRNVVQEGQWVEARVLNIDPKKRRIGLSLRQANHDHSAQHAPEPEVTAEPAS